MEEEEEEEEEGGGGGDGRVRNWNTCVHPNILSLLF